MNQSPAGTVHGRLFRSGERRGFPRREQGKSQPLKNLCNVHGAGPVTDYGTVVGGPAIRFAHRTA